MKIQAPTFSRFGHLISCALSLFLVIVTTLAANGQKDQEFLTINKKNLWIADSLRDAYAYLEALKAYQGMHKLNEKNTDIHVRLAEIYRLLKKPKDAERWYSLVVKKNTEEPTYCFYYAQALSMNRKYHQALHYFERYRMLLKGYKDLRQNANRFYQPSFLVDSSTLVIERLPMNSLGADFSPAVFRNGIVYVSARGQDLNIDAIRKKNKEAYFDIYFSALKNSFFSPPTRFSAKIDSHFHEGPLTFFDDSRQIIFTRTYAKTKRNKKDYRLFGKLRMFSSQLTDSGDSVVWDTPKMLPFSDYEVSYGHPTTDPTTDGEVLYFVSDMEGSIGKTDIYETRLENGKWGKPKNLGKLVNTRGNEMFPYYAPDGMLYFASDGLNGLGGLDIYRFDLKSKEKPVNLGYPINTIHDDFGIFLNDTSGQTGYLSSNRLRGHDDDDIYRFYRMEDDSLYQLADSMSTILVEVNELSTTQDNPTIADNPMNTAPVTDENNSDVPANETISLTTSTDEARERALQTEKFLISDPMIVVIEDGAKFQILKKKGKRLVRYRGKLPPPFSPILQIQPIYFGLDQSSIDDTNSQELNKLTNIMMKYPSVSLQISTHTDSRGETAYNQALSVRRANSVIDYLSSAGINKKRVLSRPKGEKELVNDCGDEKDCSEAQHRLNRRVSFKLKP